MSIKQTEALKLALECIEAWDRGANASDYWRDRFDAITAIREALADSALDRMADNARELGLDYEPPCKTGSQCTSKCQQCDEPHEQPHCNDCGGFDPECPLVQPAQQQEPVAWRTKNATPPGGYVVFQQYPQAVAELGGEIEPLYTSPPASKPLTDEQVETAFKAWHYKHGNNTQGIKWVDDLLRSCWKAAIEAAHGIKGDA